MRAWIRKPPHGSRGQSPRSSLGEASDSFGGYHLVRYQGQRPHLDYRIWRLRQRPRQMPAGQELRILLRAPFTLHWGVNGWQNAQDAPSEDWGLAHLVTLPTRNLQAGENIQFTIYWQDSGRWQGEDFHLDIIGVPV